MPRLPRYCAGPRYLFPLRALDTAYECGACFPPFDILPPNFLPMTQPKTHLLALVLTPYLLTFGAPRSTAQDAASPKGEAYGEFNPGNNKTPGAEWIQTIVIKSRELRAEVKGDV